MKITIRRGSFLNEDTDAVIIPANSTGSLLGELLDEVKAVAGEEVEEAAIAQAPVHVGEAIATTPGLLRCKAVIHASITEYPDGEADEHAVKSAIEAALDLAEENRFQRIALPLRWTMPTAVASDAVLRVLHKYPVLHVQEAILEDHEEALVLAWQAAERKMRIDAAQAPGDDAL